MPKEKGGMPWFSHLLKDGIYFTSRKCQKKISKLNLLICRAQKRLHTQLAKMPVASTPPWMPFHTALWEKTFCLSECSPADTAVRCICLKNLGPQLFSFVLNNSLKQLCCYLGLKLYVWEGRGRESFFLLFIS